MENIPLSFGGRASFMVENILVATAAAYVQRISLGNIRKALCSFIPSPEHTPGRMNIFNFENFDVMVDYAHNPAGMETLKEFFCRFIIFNQNWDCCRHWRPPDGRQP